MANHIDASPDVVFCQKKNPAEAGLEQEEIEAATDLSTSAILGRPIRWFPVRITHAANIQATHRNAK